MNRVIEEMARVYPQLYLVPGEEGAQEAYARIVRRGEDAPSHAAGHFRGSSQDRIDVEKTPAGEVLAVTLGDRHDFELFLQIMANRCADVEIPATQGASILDGVINWPKIRAHKATFFANGGMPFAWNEEFKRFTAEPANYKDALIVLSTGPYSAVQAEETGLSEQAWLKASYQIRKAHECTHFICRRLFPDKINVIWDEVAADAVGLYSAFGTYQLRLAERFLGITPEGRYTGGRLENYAGHENLDSLAVKVHQTLLHLEKVIQEAANGNPYELAVRLEEELPFWMKLTADSTK